MRESVFTSIEKKFYFKTTAFSLIRQNVIIKPTAAATATATTTTTTTEQHMNTL